MTSLGSEGKTLDMEALVLPKITSVLPSHPIPFSRKWKHLMNISLADPDFDTPGNVYLLLGADIFSRVVLYGRLFGPTETTSALKTCFGWVLAGVVHGRQQPAQSGICCFSTPVDDLLKRFWEIEYCLLQQPVFSLDEQPVVEHFHIAHIWDRTKRYFVPLPMKTDVTPLGESRSLAVGRFKALERSLWAKSQYDGFTSRCGNILRWITQNTYPH